MNTYYVRPMDLHTWIETCQEKCTAVVTLKDHEAEVQKLKDLGQRIDDELVAAQRSLAAFQYPPDHRVSVAERERDEAESRLEEVAKAAELISSHDSELRRQLASAHSRLDAIKLAAETGEGSSQLTHTKAALRRILEILSRDVERPVTICGEMFPPGQFSVQQCTLPKGHAGEHANNVKGL